MIVSQSVEVQKSGIPFTPRMTMVWSWVQWVKSVALPLQIVTSRGAFPHRQYADARAGIIRVRKRFIFDFYHKLRHFRAAVMFCLLRTIVLVRSLSREEKKLGSQLK